MCYSQRCKTRQKFIKAFAKKNDLKIDPEEISKTFKS